MPPNLTNLTITYDHGSDWLRVFQGATLGKLESIEFHCESDQTGDFLEAFEKIALATSISATLSRFSFYTTHPWRPNYRSLLPFTQLKRLIVEFSCEGDCSSTIDDGTITDLARAMPMLEILHLGDSPCRTPGGVTAKGLAALAHYCLGLSNLRIHFHVDSLNLPEVPAIVSDGGSALPREDCALTTLEVGDIHVPRESTLMVAMTLVRLFPRLSVIYWRDEDEGWDKIEDALSCSKRFANCSSGRYLLATPRSNVDDTSPRNRTRDHHMVMKRAEVPEYSDFTQPSPTFVSFLPHACYTFLALLSVDRTGY